ncbi:MAG: DUF2382 domain-containing protein [Akkermansiaceae bacterium]|nr:DUF2382 domain-containing protein [Armatimonadota bacterium]
MAKTIVGLFDTFAHAQSAVNDLISAGFNRDDISVVANNASGEFGTHDGDHNGVNVSQAGGDAVKGAVKGGMYGGLTALAATVALALIPGIGPIAAIGPLSAFLGGAALGATAGGILGGLTGLGVPEHEAGYYAEGIRRGGTLVTIHADDSRASEATNILNRYNPVDMDTRVDYYKSTGFTKYDEKLPAYTASQIEEERTRYSSLSAPSTATDTSYSSSATATPMAATDRTVNAGETISVPVVEEQLTVGKRSVEGGGARIHTRVVETPVTESVTLHEERVTVDRQAVNRTANAADLNNAFQETNIELRERSEVPVVAKEARIVEEVTIGKTATDRTETVSDTVRRTDVDVEELDRDDSTVYNSTTSTTGSRN